MSTKMNLEETVKKFLHTLENRESFEELIPFYHPDVEQIEFPNTLTKRKAVRNLDALKEAGKAGKNVLKSEKYEIVKTHSLGTTVIIEAVWTGILAIPIGKLDPGSEMKAYFAQFYEFEDGKIISQRNYDCFEPFE
ncbi:MAG: nuclear transport factor 2 family protein [Muricauda sp.]|nr:nuclear transport factor 2 family protein [Allomuricauda sp.]